MSLQHTVQTRIVFLKLSDIDTVKEQFAAEVFIESRWPEKSLDHGKVNFSVCKLGITGTRIAYERFIANIQQGFRVSAIARDDRI